jgi:hypothetical protein
MKEEHKNIKRQTYFGKCKRCDFSYDHWDVYCPNCNCCQECGCCPCNKSDCEWCNDPDLEPEEYCDEL